MKCTCCTIRRLLACGQQEFNGWSHQVLASWAPIVFPNLTLVWIIYDLNRLTSRSGTVHWCCSRISFMVRWGGAEAETLAESFWEELALVLRKQGTWPLRSILFFIILADLPHSNLKLTGINPVPALFSGAWPNVTIPHFTVCSHHQCNSGFACYSGPGQKGIYIILMSSANAGQVGWNAAPVGGIVCFFSEASDKDAAMC